LAKLLLLFSKLPEDRSFAAEVALTAGLSLKVVGSAAEAAAILDADEPVATFVDVSSRELYQEFEAAIQESIGLFSEKINAGAIHFISSLSLDQVEFLVQSPLFGNYVLRNYHDMKVSGARYGRIIRAGLRSEKAFGLENFLAEGTKIQTVKLVQASQKQGAVEAVRKFLGSANFPARATSVVANAVDEILMNAIFDAPVDHTGRQLHGSLARTTELKLEDKSSVEMQVGFDGHLVGITAIDHFGSLDKQRLLSHLAKIYSTEEYKVRTAVAGAGIGLASVFKSGGSFFFASESHLRTEVTVFFERTENFKDFKDQFRFISTQFYF
jgi:hypothetical protein